MILAILLGIIFYFKDYRDTKILEEIKEETKFSENFPETTSKEQKYDWVIWLFGFSLLLMIPCLGFIGAVKEHICLLILYGVIFSVETIILLIFKSTLFLIPAMVTLASLGLVFLIQSDKEKSTGSSRRNSRMTWCLDKV